MQVKIYYWKSVMLVTALSAKHFLVVPLLSIMFSDCTRENSFCNLKLKRFITLPSHTFSLNEFDCLHALQNLTLLQSLRIFCFPDVFYF